MWSIGGMILMGRNQSPGVWGGGHTVIVLRMLRIYPSHDTILSYHLCMFLKTAYLTNHTFLHIHIF